MSAYVSREKMQEKARIEAEADAKADGDPALVTGADLANMSDEKRSAFIASGAGMVHLGIGAPKRRGRYR